MCAPASASRPAGQAGVIASSSWGDVGGREGGSRAAPLWKGLPSNLHEQPRVCAPPCKRPVCKYAGSTCSEQQGCHCEAATPPAAALSGRCMVQQACTVELGRSACCKLVTLWLALWWQLRFLTCNMSSRIILRGFLTGPDMAPAGEGGRLEDLCLGSTQRLQLRGCALSQMHVPPPGAGMYLTVAAEFVAADVTFKSNNHRPQAATRSIPLPGNVCLDAACS